MKVDTIKGSSYVMTCTKACTVSAIFNSGETSMLILEAEKKGNTVLRLRRTPSKYPMKKP